MLHEAGLREKVVDVPVQTTALKIDPIAQNANPLGKIPVLVLECGKTIFDSRVICRYLNGISDAGLYPEDRLWDILTLEALADGIMESAVLMVYEARLRPEEKRSESWVDAQWEKISNALAALEVNAFSAMQGSLNFGQLAIACSLGYLELRHKERRWKEDHTQLAMLNEKLQNRFSLKETIPGD